MRLLLAQLNPIIGDIAGNTQKILVSIEKGKEKNCDLILFPELCLTGYPPKDLLLLDPFIAACEKALETIISHSKGIAVVLGTPRLNPQKQEKHLFNSAAIIEDGELLGYQDKCLLPTYDIFDEHRYFEPAHTQKVWTLKGKKVAVTICEDIWSPHIGEKMASYRRNPIEELQKQEPDLMLNLSASPYQVTKFQEREAVCVAAAKALGCPVLLCNQVGGNDSLIFDGHSLYIKETGELCHYAHGFEEDFMVVDLAQLKCPKQFLEDPLHDLHAALVLGIRDYCRKSGFCKTCIGVSGGIDSALVAALAVDALGKENVLGVMMPSRYSSQESLRDAIILQERLGIATETIPIEGPFQAYLDTLTPHFKGKAPDATEENLQARIRGMLLMALSNKHGYLILSTGNKSEVAMGYATLYGDMCGGLAVISDVTKQQVYALSHWINRNQEIIPHAILEKPPSAELRPNQKDSDTLPDYAIVDKVLEGYVERHLSPETIAREEGIPLSIVSELIDRIHRNEYKRKQSPPGLRVTSKAFSVGRHFPIVQKWN